jgi:predicted ribosomally synthesized peptide with SipW-like signal peptide
MSLPRRSFAIALSALLLLGSVAFAEDAPERKSHARIYVAGAGALLLAGGGALAYFQNREADRDMAVYRNSAFTGNTLEYRDRVEEHQRLTWLGLAGAALGGILVVVSF